MNHPRRWLAILILGVASCRAPTEDEPEAAGKVEQSVVTAFSWSMAGVLLVASEPLSGTPAELLDAHFSYVGQYAVNGCATNTTPYSCANNGCVYPGNPTAEILSYTLLRDWMIAHQSAGLYVGPYNGCGSFGFGFRRVPRPRSCDDSRGALSGYARALCLGLFTFQQ